MRGTNGIVNRGRITYNKSPKEVRVMEFFDVLSRRESCRSYTDTPVMDDELMRCLEAARMAPSACNSQPWSFIAVRTGDQLQALAKCASGGGMNRFAAQCPCIVAVVEEKGNLTARIGAKRKDQDYASMDIGIAAAHFCLAATAQGLSTCILGWFDEPGVKALLDIPTQKRVRLLLCLGYATQQDIRVKSRKPMDEIVRFV